MGGTDPFTKMNIAVFGGSWIRFLRMYKNCPTVIWSGIRNLSLRIHTHQDLCFSNNGMSLFLSRSQIAYITKWTVWVIQEYDSAIVHGVSLIRAFSLLQYYLSSSIPNQRYVASYTRCSCIIWKEGFESLFSDIEQTEYFLEDFVRIGMVMIAAMIKTMRQTTP